MTPAAAQFLKRSEAARVCYSVLRTPLSVPQLAHALRGIVAAKTVGSVVRTLRIAGLVVLDCVRRAWPSRRPVKVWRRA